MKLFWQSGLSLVLGFIGGIVAMNTNLHFKWHGPEARAETVRATRFELVDPSGNLLAYWGKDKPGLNTEIAFVDEKDTLRATFGVEASQLKAGRPIVYSPFTELIGSDGKVRLRQQLDGLQNPVLAMGDSASENRLLLGHWNTRDVAGAKDTDPWDKWSLVFRDPSHGWRDYVDIGTTTLLGTEQRTGYAILRNSTNRQLSMLPKQ